MELQIYQLTKFAVHSKNGKERYAIRMVYFMFFRLFSRGFQLEINGLKNVNYVFKRGRLLNAIKPDQSSYKVHENYFCYLTSLCLF